MQLCTCQLKLLQSVHCCKWYLSNPRVKRSNERTERVVRVFALFLFTEKPRLPRERCGNDNFAEAVCCVENIYVFTFEFTRWRVRSDCMSPQNLKVCARSLRSSIRALFLVVCSHCLLSFDIKWPARRCEYVLHSKGYCVVLEEYGEPAERLFST